MGQGEIQRAELFRNVDELMLWKKGFELKQAELIQWQDGVMTGIEELSASVKTTLEGCRVLVDCDTSLMEKCNELSTRIDILNKRMRRAEEAIGRLNPR